jgi:soluble lytic murein transglycosylase-like protein
MTFITKSDHLKIVKQIKRRAILIHVCGIVLVICLLSIPWAYNIERGIIVESYQTVKHELDSIQLRQELLQILRKRSLTVGAALDIMEAVTSQNKIPVPIILAVLEQESQFDPRAISPKGARGAGQLMPVVWKQYGNGTSIHDPLSNVTASIAYLSDLYKRFGSWKRTFRAYYGGPDHVDDKRLDIYANAVIKKAGKYGGLR